MAFMFENLDVYQKAVDFVEQVYFRQACPCGFSACHSPEGDTANRPSYPPKVTLESSTPA